MRKDQRFNEISLVVLAAVQFILCSLALFLPDLIVGTMSRGDAEKFMEALPEESENENQKVQAQIGFFMSFINGIVDGNNREGMVGVFGFALLSTLSSFITLLLAIQLLCQDTCPCSEKCEDGCIWLSEQLSNLAKSNYSSGVSGFAAFSMTAFTAKDLEGGYVGTNFYLQIMASCVSAIIHVNRSSIEKNVKRKRSKQRVRYQNLLEKEV